MIDYWMEEGLQKRREKRRNTKESKSKEITTQHKQNNLF